MFEKILRHFRSVATGREDESIDRSANAVFVLMYGDLPMAILSHISGEWTFAYTDEFKAQKEIAPLVPFRDLEKIYRSSELWPFFLVRIPSVARPEVERTIREENLDSDDLASMLQRFGRKSIADPYVLQPKNDTETPQTVAM